MNLTALNSLNNLIVIVVTFVEWSSCRMGPLHFLAEWHKARRPRFSFVSFIVVNSYL